MKTTLIEVWKQARNKYFSVNLDTKDHQAVIYKGIKVVNDNGNIRIYSTETDFYEDITDYFNKDSFDIGVKEFLLKKYLIKLNEIEKYIQEELNNSKNHKRFSYLKSMREFYLNKYNEINT